MTRTILKSTERGQITLPHKWREHFATNSYLVEMYDDKLIIVPFNLNEAVEEEVLFDADRDNNGNGVSPDEMIKAIKKIQHERNR